MGTRRRTDLRRARRRRDSGADDLSGDPAIGAVCHADPDGKCATDEHAGLTVCQGASVMCAGAKLLAENQVAESCNGKDDDCDGTVDDAPLDAGGACGTSNLHPCAFGKLVCSAGKLACVGAIGPGVESCNGLDDDCDGAIDLSGSQPPVDSVGACDVPPSPPAGATSPCKAGMRACLGGVVVCQGSVGPSSASDSCGVDANCNGTLEGQPDLKSDPHHCGACGNDCAKTAIHALVACVGGACVTTGCEAGYHDLDANGSCEYGCVASGAEQCDGLDNDCDGAVDEGIAPPLPSKVCGVSIAATRPECTSLVTVACVGGTWACTFPTGVCGPTCSNATEVCDGLDNDCDGLVNENVAGFGSPCASDDAAPTPGHGACRTTGVMVCDGPNAVRCNAVKADCASLPGGCEESCDGLDNDCDGLVDEPFTERGPNAAFFVRPEVTQTAEGRFVFRFEASRPSATATSAGLGNGYTCVGEGCPPWLLSASLGVPLDATPACSVAGRFPWFNVTAIEAEQTCDALGGHVCRLEEWQATCRATAACSWGYAPRGSACKSVATSTKYCNLLEFDFSTSVAGDQSGLLPGGSPLLASCGVDFSGLYGNTTPRVVDLTGNLREIVFDDAAGTYRLMGGGFGTSEAGATCDFTFYAVAPTYQLYDTGFRCCFDVDPRL